jgi:integration host factor subunit beta
MSTGGSMTKAELVEEVSRVSDLTKKHSEIIVETVFQSIIDALHRGEKIELRGFGSFRLRQREPRKGRNPKTGDKVDVPPKKVPYFKPGKELKDLLNREPESAASSPGLAVPDLTVLEGSGLDRSGPNRSGSQDGSM